MSKQEGPRVKIDASCFNCTHQRSSSYAVQGDSGHDVSCVHPEAQDDGRIGDSTWRTPAWCPLLPVAIESLIRNHTAEKP